MKPKLKPIEDQVIVITGASSGIGLATARLAASQGAKLVLAARTVSALDQLCREITAAGGSCFPVAADVGDFDDVKTIRDAALARYGRIDTWVNNAGVSIYGRIEEIPIPEFHKVFETNFWGVVYGSVVAAEALREGGGAIVNIGSVLSERAIPLQGIYTASKHAVKGFTDSFRMELDKDGAPISVTLVKPGAIDTPYTRHAKNYMREEATNPGPVYSPEVVAETILHCAENPVRDIFVGGGAKAMSLAETLAPRLTDRLMTATMFAKQKKDRPERDRGDHALYRGKAELRTRGDYEGHVARSSWYTSIALHPVRSAIALAGIGLGISAVLARARAARAAARGRGAGEHPAPEEQIVAA